MVADLPVARAFSHRAFSCFLGSAKPEPECYQAVLAMLGARPADVVFIDDRPENVAGAAALGIRGVHFSSAAAGAGRAGRASAWPPRRAAERASRERHGQSGAGVWHDDGHTGVRHFVANVTHPF